MTGIIEFMPLTSDAGGLVDICTSIDVAFAALASECVPEDHPLYDCFPEDRKSTLCCEVQMRAEASISAEPDSSCIDGSPDCAPTTTLLGVAESGACFSGVYPFGYPTDATTLVVCCNSSTVTATILDASGSPITEDVIGSIVWDPDTLSGTIFMTIGLGECCEAGDQGSGGRIDISIV